MDNEFRWRQQMRKLNAAVEPARDLWPDIAARIAAPAAAAPRRPRRRSVLVIAASLIVAVGTGLTAHRLSRTLSAPAPADFRAGAAALTALDWARPADPGLDAAAQDLDKASAELQAALEARPDAVFLVGMLNRTHAQRLRLLRQGGVSG